jgi:hypothetical protein
MVKEKKASYLDRFRKDIDKSVAELDLFDKNEILKEYFWGILIESLDIASCYSKSDYADVNIKHLEQNLEFLVEIDEKLETNELKELYWFIVSFIFEQVNLKAFDISSKVYQTFGEDETDSLFLKAEITFENFLLILSKSSLLKLASKIPTLPNFKNLKISYQRYFEPRGDFCWYRDFDGETEYSNVVLEGDLVVIDGKTFDQDFLNGMSTSEIGLLKSKFFRVFALVFSEGRDSESESLNQAKESLLNDKSLKKLFIKTMKRNLCEISTYSPEELHKACTQSRIPLYRELKDFLSYHSLEIHSSLEESFLDFL